MRHPSTPGTPPTRRLVAAGTELTLAPRAGSSDDFDDIAREDDRAGDGHGYERDETDTQLRHLVRHLVADGDARAQAAGRRTRRTHADMAPGVERQPVLHLAPAVTFRPSAAQLAVTV